MSDPCQIKERGSRTICGWQGRSLQPHLRVHKGWTLARYKKTFKKFSIGEPAFKPPPEIIEKNLIMGMRPEFREAREQEAKRQREEEEKRLAEIAGKELARFEELWAMCERDPAARAFCMSCAKDEAILSDAYARLEEAHKSKKYDDLKYINSTIAATSERLRENMKSLSLTVEQRRKSNQLGNDTVSQLISNYVNTLRKKSPESQDAFHRRVAAVISIFKQRVRDNLLAEIITEERAAAEVTTDDDYRAAISKFRDKT